MPLSQDSKVAETSDGLLKTLQGIFGPHPGFRPAHAKGVLLKGTFTPTDEAKVLSVAQHFNQETPVIGRFSNSTGIPVLPDTDPNGNPRGFALRFTLQETPRRIHTDIIAHSTPFFPAADPEEALGFFKAAATGKVPEWLPTHPAALAFVTAPKPTPSSFGSQKYFAVHAYKLVDSAGKGTFIRYSFIPVAGESYISEEDLKAKGADFLFDEVTEGLKTSPVEFKLVAQIAEEGDVTDNNTIHWPETRRLVTLGTVSLSGLVEDDAAQQKTIIFDPIPRVPGVEPSADPLLEVRAHLYLASGKERRAA